MTTQAKVVVAAAVVVLAGGVDAGAQTRASAATGWQAPGTLRRAALDSGTISSIVRDASGSPVSGAIVSAVGGRTVTALTDARLHSRLSRVRAGYGFAPAGRFQLAGFDEPLEVFQLIR